MSATVCSLPKATCHELQNDLQVAPCAELGDAWEKLSSDLKLAAASASLGLLSKR